jgi:hypothetical protein
MGPPVIGWLLRRACLWVSSPTWPPHVITSISVREIKPSSCRLPLVVAPPRSEPPPPSSPVGTHAASSSLPLPFAGHRRRCSHPPPMFSPVSATPTFLCFPPPTTIARLDAFPPPWAGRRPLPQCGEACSTELWAAHPLEPIDAIVFHHPWDHRCYQPSPVRSPNVRPLKRVPHLILSLTVLSVQHLVATALERAGTVVMPR